MHWTRTMLAGVFVALLMVGSALAEAPKMPRGWRFALPKGNAQAGEKAFERMECFEWFESEAGKPQPRRPHSRHVANLRRTSPDREEIGCRAEVQIDVDAAPKFTIFDPVEEPPIVRRYCDVFADRIVAHPPGDRHVPRVPLSVT